MALRNPPPARIAPLSPLKGAYPLQTSPYISEFLRKFRNVKVSKRQDLTPQFPLTAQGQVAELGFCHLASEVSRSFESCQEVTPDSTLLIDIRVCLPHLSSLWMLSSTANIEKQLKSYGELTDIIITKGNGYSWTGWVPA